MLKIIMYLVCTVLWAICSGMWLSRLTLQDEENKGLTIINFIMDLVLSIANASIVVLTVYRMIH